MARKETCRSVTLLSRLCGAVVSFVFLTSCAFAATTGWFYALDADVAAMEKVAGAPVRTFTIMNTTVVREYRVGKHTILAAKMGSGCLTTAVTVARVADVRNLDFVISTGPAGALDGSSKLGEWVRTGDVLAWQMGNAGESERIDPGKSAEFSINTSYEWPEGAWSRFPQIKLISGEAFVANAQVRDTLATRHAAAAVEMNSAGLLMALDGSAAKVLVLRVISDHADDNAGETFAAFTKSYDGEGGRMVYEIVRNLPVPLNDPSAHGELRKLLEGK